MRTFAKTCTSHSLGRRRAKAYEEFFLRTYENTWTEAGRNDS